MVPATFRFRLERVRALRERDEKHARRELALAIGKLTASEDALRQTNSQLAEAHAGQRSATADGALSGAEMRASQAFFERIEVQRMIGTQEVHRTAGEVADRGADLSRAAQKHAALERLKERRRGEHMREVARRERQILDEIALDRFRRRAA
jgi:flagellar FliJ protein